MPQIGELHRAINARLDRMDAKLDEPEAQTCGDAFNNAWQCYCAYRPSRPLRPPIATTENICAPRSRTAPD